MREGRCLHKSLAVFLACLLIGLAIASLPMVALAAVPPAPVITSPGSASEPGTVLSTLTPTLQWNVVSGADYYALAISKYPYGSGNIIYNPQQVTGTSHVVPSGTLVAGEKYRWNMQAHNSAGWSAVSNTLYFQTQTTTYTLTVSVQGQGTVSPSGGSYASGTQVTLTATPASGWQFSGWSGDLTGSQNPATITMNSNKSVTATFVQQATPPPAPTITSPGSASEPGPVLSTLTPTLQWNAVSSADYYAVAISKYPYGSGNIIYNPQQLTGTSHVVPSGTLVAGEKYRWNMQAHNSAGWSAVSNTLYFQTQQLTYTLTVNLQGQGTVSPSGGSYASGTQVTLTATPASGWQFSGWSGDLTGSQNPATITMNSNKSVTATFAQQTPPPAPVITSPGSASEPGPVLSTLTPTLQWNAVSSADYYAVAISKYPYGSGNIIYNPQQLTGTSHVVPSGTLVAGEKYRWNMQAHNSAGWSAVSNTLYFQAPPPTTVSARINSYSPTSRVDVAVGNSTPISVTFTNTGNTAWSFIAGATVWDSGGSQVANYSQTLSSPLQPSQQTTVSWTHPVNQAGDYWLQFGIWKATPFTSENLLDKKPEPSQNVIRGVAAPQPTIGYSPSSFSFTATQGGSNPSGQTLSIQNSGGGTLGWSVSDDAAWLTLSPTTGSSTGGANPVTVSVSILGMSAGTYSATITISAPGASNTPQVIPVSLTISQETITTPNTPAGPTSGQINQSLTYSAGGASSNLGHSLEYRFDWGDGSYSNWSSSTTASHSWSTQGTYAIRAQARCALHTSVLSAWSSGLSVSVTLPTGTINVTSDPAGALFTLSGPTSYTGVTPWTKTGAPVGTYTITWGFMKGYQTPAQESKNLIGGGAIGFHGLYVVMPQLITTPGLPVLESVKPAFGTLDTRVELIGKNFGYQKWPVAGSTDPVFSGVQFGQTLATVIEPRTDTKIVVKPPSDLGLGGYEAAELTKLLLTTYSFASKPLDEAVLNELVDRLVEKFAPNIFELPVRGDQPVWLQRLKSFIAEMLPGVTLSGDGITVPVRVGTGMNISNALPFTFRLKDMRPIDIEDSLIAHLASPGELRVYDSVGRLTGVVDGVKKEEIPNSISAGKTVLILQARDYYVYEVAGTNEGTYGLTVNTFTKETNTFSITDIPISAKAVHEYTIDWPTLAKGEQGVTMKIDSDGDGTFEEIKYLGQQGTRSLWVWVAVAGLTGLLGVLVGAFIVRRRIGEKQAAKR